MTEAQTHEGGCHCGKVRFRAAVDISTVMECNCSHCSKKGFLLAFTPRQNFELLSGEDETSEYRFAKHMIGHRFCKTCGVQPFAFGPTPDGKEMAAVNARCIDGVDIDALNRKAVNGKEF